MATFSSHFYNDPGFSSSLWFLLWVVLIPPTQILPRCHPGRETGWWVRQVPSVWQFQLFRPYCGPLHSLDAGWGKPLLLPAAFSICPVVLPSEYLLAIFGLFCSQTWQMPTCLFLLPPTWMLMSHQSWGYCETVTTHVHLGTYGAIISPVFVVNTGLTGFGFAI